MKIDKQTIIIILVGLVGCFLTSLTGVTAIMLTKGWTTQGGFEELLTRLSISYPASCCVVVFIFPFLIPKLTGLLNKHLS